LLVKVGMMWPVRAAGGSARLFSVAVAADAMAWPFAVRMIVLSPPVLMLVTGAVGTK
jgi:hypothetical protein